jgi:hypothetical protein
MRIPVKPKIHKLAIDVKAKVEAALTFQNNMNKTQSLKNAKEYKIQRFCDYCDESIWERSRVEPIFLENFRLEFRHAGESVNRGFLYQNAWYLVEGKFTREQQKLGVMEEADRERIYFEKLRMKFTSDSAREAAKQIDRIPEEVKIAVWRRDEGRCADCKKRENLEYHHIIPRTKGGSSTIRNIELLCEICNRKRGNRIDELPMTF